MSNELHPVLKALRGRRSPRGSIVVSRRSLALGVLAWGALRKWKIPAHAAAYEDAYAVRIGEEVDIGDIAPGQWRHFEIEGSPVFVHRLTTDEIDSRPIPPGTQIKPEKTVSKEWIALSGTCTHAGCRILRTLDRPSGFICPCHGSEFDIYGHVVRGPAKHNLPTVPYSISDAKLIFLPDDAQGGRD
jgi:ubiquinol-cytochrome c reductase iron-sulfur subunit